MLSNSEDILLAVAAADESLEAREIQLIKSFAQQWRVPLPELKAGATESKLDWVELRQTVQRYLRLSPPIQQATELLDVILHIVHADESVTDEEEIVLDEINAMIMAFVSIEDPGARFEIVLVPQTETQTALIESLLPGTEALARHGGMVYRVGEFHSSRFADQVAKKYIDLGLFTTRLDLKR